MTGILEYKKLGPMKLPSRIPNKKKPSLFDLYLFVFKKSGHKYYVLEKGKVRNKNNLLVRIDSKCVYANIFGSARCDCEEQLITSIKKIDKEGEGLLIYCYDQDGRGISLEDHMKVYKFADEGYDTVDANLKAGLKVDQRSYDDVAVILKEFGLNKIRLLTNNPHRIEELKRHGIDADRIPLKSAKLDKYNAAQLIVKQTKMGHLFGWDLNDKKIKKLFDKSMKRKWG
jgi:3,4-dihydroxy 2-butanone 4-phosphate synthase/GTP cyclohydrolase II